MVKVVKKESTMERAELPKITDEIFKLKIDRDTQKFFIDGQDKYGQFDEVTIRPIDMLGKIVAYKEDFEVKSESTLYRELKEAKDSQGGAASDKTGKVCGRIVWKPMTSKLSPEEQEENKSKAKFYTLIFGIAYIGKLEPIIVDFRVGGSKFMEVINLLKKIKEDKKEYNKAEIKITAKKNEEFDWPELEFAADFSRELPVTGLEPVIDTIDGYVEYHNEGIAKKAEKYKTWKESGGNSTYKKNTSYKRT